LLASVVASSVAKHELRRRLGSGQINVKIRTFSLTDLCAGKVKSVDVKLSHCLVKAFPIGNVKLASSMPIWFDPGFHGHKAGLRQPIQFIVDAKLNRDQIAQALNNPAVVSSIRGLKLDLPGLGAQQLQILHPNVSLSSDSIVIDCLLVTKGADEATGVHISLAGRPSIEGAKIYLRDLKVASADIPNPVEFSQFLDELFNPIVDMGRYDRKDHAFRLVDVKIDPQTIQGDGTLVFAPKPGVQLAQAPAAKSRNPLRNLF
jgi:LmeA-like phospholipid-binding